MIFKVNIGDSHNEVLYLFIYHTKPTKTRGEHANSAQEGPVCLIVVYCKDTGAIVTLFKGHWGKQLT